MIPSPLPPGWPTLAAGVALIAAIVLLVSAAVWALWELCGPPSGAHAAGQPVGDGGQDDATNDPPPAVGSMIYAAELAGYDDDRDGGWVSGACTWDDRGNGGPPTATGRPPWELGPGTFPALGMGGRGMPGPAPALEPPPAIQLPRTGRAFGGSIDAEGQWIDRWSQEGPDQPREYDVGGPESPPPDVLWSGTIRHTGPEVVHDEYGPALEGWWSHWEREHPPAPPVPPAPGRAAELAALDHDAALYLARLRSDCAAWRASWTPATGAAA